MPSKQTNHYQHINMNDEGLAIFPFLIRKVGVEFQLKAFHGLHPVLWLAPFIQGSQKIVPATTLHLRQRCTENKENMSVEWLYLLGKSFLKWLALPSFTYTINHIFIQFNSWKFFCFLFTTTLRGRFSCKLAVGSGVGCNRFHEQNCCLVSSPGLADSALTSLVGRHFPLPADWYLSWERLTTESGTLIAATLEQR